MSTPTISVVLPTYNRARMLGRAIDSVLRQDFADFELIVVDDGSSDDTADVVAAHDDRRVVYVSQGRNMGGNAARNRGVREARSQIVCLLDSDDEYLPHKLAAVKAFFEAHPQIEALIDSFESIRHSDGHAVTRLRVNPELSDSREIERLVFARKIWKATPSISARRDALFKIGLFDETLRRRQDMDLILRLVRHCRCATTDAVLWRKHQTPGSIGSTNRTFIDAVISICERHPDNVCKQESRVGLERDLARHCRSLIRKQQIAVLANDLYRIRRYFGTVSAARVLSKGFLAHLKRSVRPR